MEETPIYTPASPVAPEAADFDRAINGYAPGSYFGKCCHCKQEFMGDKRAVSCPKCAYEAAFAFFKEEAAALRTRLAEAEEARQADLRGLLMEWMDNTEPAEHHYETVKGHEVDWVAHQELFRLKAAACGLGWPLEEPAAGIQEKGGANG